MAGKEPTMTSKAADRIMEGLGEALAHAKGEVVPGLVVHVPGAVDVVAVRRRTGMTQAAFAGRIGVSLGTVRNWEQGRRVPDGPARVLLAMIERNPRVVEETLGAAA
jgi:putative transcriptional regulator